MKGDGRGLCARALRVLVHPVMYLGLFVRERALCLYLWSNSITSQKTQLSETAHCLLELTAESSEVIIS